MKRIAPYILLFSVFLTTAVWSLPPTPPFMLPTQTGNSGKYLTTDGTDPSWSAATATSVTTANEATDTTCFPVFMLDATGGLPKTNTALTYNSSTGNLGSTGFTGALTGNASTATALAADPADCSAGQIATGIAASGALTCTATPSGLTSVGATTFTGALTGNASTATALAANGANCSAGYAPLGVSAAGATEDCWQVTPAAIGAQPVDAILTAVAGLTTTAGNLFYATGADAVAVLAPGSSGQLLQSAGTSAPVWTTATFPGTATGTGTLLRANGTNWVASTITVPDTAVAGDVLYASATNVWSSLAKGSAGQQLRMNAGATAPEWTGVTVTSHAATEAATAATMYGNTHLVTGAYTVTLPTAVAGYSATFCSTTAAVFSVDLQATDYWILNGTTLTLANKISSSGFAGECVQFVATATNYYRTVMINGLFTDGGA